MGAEGGIVVYDTSKWNFVEVHRQLCDLLIPNEQDDCIGRYGSFAGPKAYQIREKPAPSTLGEFCATWRYPFSSCESPCALDERRLIVAYGTNIGDGAQSFEEALSQMAWGSRYIEPGLSIETWT